MNAQPSHLPTQLVALDAAKDTIEPGATAALITAALAAEGGAVLLRPSPRARTVLSHLPPRIPVVAVLPDMPQLLRDVSDLGALRAVFGRVGATQIRAWMRLAVTTILHLRALASQDFRGIVPVLIELERAAFGEVALYGVALSASLTDLLLAAGHRDCLAHVVTFLRRRVGTRVGFETVNLGHLLPRLAAWAVAPDFVIGPLNPRGFRMKPSARRVLDAVHASAIPVLASEVSAGRTVPLANGVEYARRHGAAGVVLTLEDLAPADHRGTAR